MNTLNIKNGRRLSVSCPLRSRRDFVKRVSYRGNSTAKYSLFGHLNEDYPLEYSTSDSERAILEPL